MKKDFDIWFSPKCSLCDHESYLLILCNYSFDVTSWMKKWQSFWIFKNFKINIQTNIQINISAWWKKILIFGFHQSVPNMWVCSFYVTTVLMQLHELRKGGHFEFLNLSAYIKWKNILILGFHQFSLFDTAHLMWKQFWCNFENEEIVAIVKFNFKNFKIEKTS